MASLQDFKVRKGLQVGENTTVAGNTTINGFANVGGTFTVANSSSHTGAATFANTLSVTGATTLSSSLGVSGVSTFGAANATFDTNVLSIDATNNRVGVNTSLGQTVAFVVTGDANVTGTFTAANISFTNISGTTLTISGNSNFDSGTLFVDSVNNRVGINNTSPDASLAVTGTANVSGNMRVGGSITGVLASSFSNTLGVTGATTLSSTLGVTGNATFSNTIAVTGAATLSTSVTTPKITLSAGEANGIFWPADAYGGTGDTASIALTRSGTTGEATRMTFTLTNDSDDLFAFSAPSNSGMQLNGYTIWNSGNDGSGSGLDADYLDGLHANSSSSASTVVARDASQNFSANNITANLSGTATNANTLLWNSAYRSADNAATINTIVARDGSANFSANVITATATAARYADLAEYYVADAEYPVGTVMAVGGDEEVTAASLGDGARPIGVVSAKPGFIMNEGLAEKGGTAVALKGRVPVRVQGPVRKGQALGASTTKGVAQGVSASDIHFAVALEATNGDNQLVEAIIL